MLTITTNLGTLGYFKYDEFLLDNWQWLMSSIGIEYVVPELSIILPVGVSFYTFQTMAYSLDICFKRAVPPKSFLDFSFFISFFHN